MFLEETRSLYIHDEVDADNLKAEVGILFDITARQKPISQYKVFGHGAITELADTNCSFYIKQKTLTKFFNIINKNSSSNIYNTIM